VVLSNKFIFFILVCFATSVFAMDCRLAQLLNHPTLAGNADFWEKFGKINPNNNKALEDLIKEYNPELLNQGGIAVSSTAGREVFRLSRDAEKAKSKLNVQNQKKFDEFVQMLTEKGPQGFYEQPGKWRPEKLKRNKDEHTVHLHGDYRVLYEIKDGVVNILDIANTGRSVGH